MPWPSPIATTDVASAGRRVGWPSARDGQVWWTEDRPEEGGRTTIMHRAADGAVRELLAAPWSARTRVHEYGGRPYTVTEDLRILFTADADQRVHLLGGTPRPITPDDGARYADLLARDGRVWAVRETGGSSRSIVSLPVTGGAITEWVSGDDFYAAPVLSPGGTHLAYVAWNHPRMPWNGTELRVLRLSDRATWTVRGGAEESVLFPRWRDDDHLYLLSDVSGWWNLCLIGRDGSGFREVHRAAEEFAWPPWKLGWQPYAVLGDGRVAVLHGRGDLRLGILDPALGTLSDVGPGGGWDPALAADGSTLVGLRYDGTTPKTVTRIDLRSGAADGFRPGVPSLPDPGYLPTPRPVAFEGGSGRRVHAYLYAPAHPVARAAGPVPYVVFVHGGPTGHATGELDLEKAFFTSRGIGVLDLNYGGSSGYGRAYRDLLKGRWGGVDVEDTVAAAGWLSATGAADPARIAVRGGSAGGWTVMAACGTSDVFAGGVSYYGVSSLASLAASTHDFESRYLEWLVDPALYLAREPLSHVDGVSCPMLLLQGLDDPVVPPEQSAAFADALTERGVPCTYLAFEGESHGFRRAETRTAALAAELAFYQQLFWQWRP
jgi:dienelactone hydrolase